MTKPDRGKKVDMDAQRQVINNATFRNEYYVVKRYLIEL